MITTKQSTFTFQQKTLDLDDGNEMRYFVADPLEEKDKALLLVLHWGWDRSLAVPENYGEEFLKGFALNALEESGYRPVIIAPDCPYKIWHCHESEEALLKLIDMSLDRFKIKDNQTILMGYSAGGIGAWYFGSRNAERIKICIPIASLPENEWKKNWSIENTFIIQAENDQLFPLEHIQKVEKKLKKKLSIPDMTVIKNAGHYDTGKFGYSLEELFRYIKEESKEESYPPLLC